MENAPLIIVRGLPNLLFGDHRQERHPKMQVRGSTKTSPLSPKVKSTLSAGRRVRNGTRSLSKITTARLKDACNNPANEKLQRIRQCNSYYEVLPKNNAQRTRRRGK